MKFIYRSLKKYVTRKIAFFDPPFNLSHFVFFSPTPAPLYYERGGHYGMKLKEIFLYILMLEHIKLHQKRSKRLENAVLTYVCTRFYT